MRNKLPGLLAPWIVGFVAVFATLFVISPALVRGGFPLDDGWISQVMARNLATTGVWGFEPGLASSGATSILWTLVLAINHLLFQTDPALFAGIINTLLVAGTCIALYYILIHDGLARPAAAMLALLPSLFGNTLWLAATGLETVLFVFLSTAAILLWSRGSKWAGAAAGLVALTRPEGAGLAILLTAFSLANVDNRKFRAIASIAGPTALATLITIVLSTATNGGLLPTTLEGRRWLYGIQGPPSIEQILAFARLWTFQLLDCGLGRSGMWPKLALIPGLFGIWVAIRRMSTLRLLVLWAIAINLLYLVVLPDAGHGGRYQPLNLLLAPLMAALGLAASLRWSQRRFPRAITLFPIVASILVATATVPTLPSWKSVTRLGVEHVGRTHIRLAEWIRDNLPPETRVAAFDIGALGYFSQHPILDLGGLIDRNYLPFLQQGRVTEYIAKSRTHYIALAVGFDDRIPEHNIGFRLGIIGNRHVTLLRIVNFASPRHIWAPAFRATGHHSPAQALYRIEIPPPQPSSKARAPD